MRAYECLRAWTRRWTRGSTCVRLHFDIHACFTVPTCVYLHPLLHIILCLLYFIFIALLMNLSIISHSVQRLLFSCCNIQFFVEINKWKSLNLWENVGKYAQNLPPKNWIGKNLQIFFRWFVKKNISWNFSRNASLLDKKAVKVRKNAKNSRKFKILTLSISSQIMTWSLQRFFTYSGHDYQYFSKVS